MTHPAPKNNASGVQLWSLTTHYPSRNSLQEAAGFVLEVGRGINTQTDSAKGEGMKRWVRENYSNNNNKTQRRRNLKCSCFGRHLVSLSEESSIKLAVSLHVAFFFFLQV